MKIYYRPKDLTYILIENDCFYIMTYKNLNYPKGSPFMEHKTNHPHKIKTIIFLQHILNKPFKGLCA